jgi:hypothetical protein
MDDFQPFMTCVDSYFTNTPTACDLLAISIDKVKGFKGILAKLVGFDGAYMRFTGEVTVERFEGDKKMETVKEKSAVWELMYFGHTPRK